MPSALGGAVAQVGARGGVGAGYTVLGIPQAIAKLTGVDSVVRLTLGQIMAGAAIHLEAEAKGLVPVITGNLRSGIHRVKTGSYSHEVTASSLAGTNADKNGKEYAGFVENGTSVMAGRFFMEQAFQNTLPLVQAEIVALAKTIEAL